MTVARYSPQLANVYLGLAADAKPVARIGDRFLETDTLILSIFGNAGAWLPIGKYVAATPLTALGI